MVRLDATRYVWKPDRPKMDQTEKKQITSSTAVEDAVKERKQELLQRPTGPAGFVRTVLKDICQDSPAGRTPGLGPPGPLKEEKKKSDTEPGAQDAPVLPANAAASQRTPLRPTQR